MMIKNAGFYAIFHPYSHCIMAAPRGILGDLSPGYTAMVFRMPNFCIFRDNVLRSMPRLSAACF